MFQKFFLYVITFFSGNTQFYIFLFKSSIKAVSCFRFSVKLSLLRDNEDLKTGEVVRDFSVQGK